MQNKYTSAIGVCKLPTQAQTIGRHWQCKKTGQSVKDAKAQMSTGQFKGTFPRKAPLSIKKALFCLMDKFALNMSIWTNQA